MEGLYPPYYSVGGSERMLNWIRHWNVGDKDVLEFIDTFMSNVANVNEQEVLRKTFRAGYCYYFAHMLKKAFGRGKVCWAAPFGHMVWVDTDGTPYDVEGVYYGEAQWFIPESYLGDCIWDFMHVPNKTYNATQKDLDSIIEKYKKDNGLCSKNNK